MGWRLWVEYMLPVALALRAGRWYLGSRVRHGPAPAPLTHKPDYAKIARLEIELGLVPPPTPPPAPLTISDAAAALLEIRRLLPPAGSQLPPPASTFTEYLAQLRKQQGK